MAIARTSPVALTWTSLQSLASGSACQTAVVTSGTTQNVTDIVANWVIAMPSATASATTRVDVYCWGTNDSAGYPGTDNTNEVITGSSGGINISTNGQSALRFLKATPLLLSTTTHNVRDEASVVGALGFVPARWGLVFSNQTGATMPASGHSAEHVETYYT